MSQFTLLSHKSHNPECDIVTNRINSHSEITWGIYVKGPKAGTEFVEYYSGPNYIVTSQFTRKKSYSRCWPIGEAPKRYSSAIKAAKQYYEEVMNEEKYYL